MDRWYRTLSVSVFVLLALLSVWLWPASSKPNPKVQSPSLVVLLVFDQLRADYLQRWYALLERDGFRRLLDQGAWFQNCHYPYANTMTGPGHATLVTGCSPDQHGIVGNDWYERKSRTQVNCVGTERHLRVPPTASKPKKPNGADPERLLQPTVADVMKQHFGKEVRVVALSLKDRGAILPGGKAADVCCWSDRDGQFVTSTRYADRLPAWVDAFNRSGFAAQWAEQSWHRLLPNLDYTKHAGPDDVVGEGYGKELGRTFPHVFPTLNGNESARRKYYEALGTSPFGNDLVLELARRAIDAERLGTRATPDFLSISFSSNDLVGHAWGPDSQEVLDTTLRSDRILRDLLAHLDARVGKGRYLVVLSADHGVCPLPEVARAQGWDARRVDPGKVAAAIETFLDGRFPAKQETASGRWIEAFASNMIYFDRSTLTRRGVSLSAAANALADWLVAEPNTGIAVAITRDELLAGKSNKPYFEAVRRSFHPERSGDVMVVGKPYYLMSNLLGGTSHGTPYPYDTHVPLLVMGPGVRPGIRQQRVTPEDAAVILAAALKMPPPAGTRRAVPEGLFEESFTTK
jgi:predicted AlkP superfamily pyrophosphatase or phosphodiesterase